MPKMYATLGLTIILSNRTLSDTTVLDSVSQICDVVLVRRTFSSGIPQGVGILEWGGEKWGDQFTSNLGPRWIGSYHSKEGSK
jgi:hypothetical protein